MNLSIRKDLPWPRQLIVVFSPQETGFDPWSVHVRFVVDHVALEQVFFRAVQFCPVSIITALFVGDCMWGVFVTKCVSVLVICVLVFTVFCIVCTVFLYCFVYVHLFLVSCLY